MHRRVSFLSALANEDVHRQAAAMHSGAFNYQEHAPVKLLDCRLTHFSVAILPYAAGKVPVAQQELRLFSRSMHSSRLEDPLTWRGL